MPPGRALRTLPDRLRRLDLTSAKLPAKQATPFYLSPEWRALMAHVRATRPNRCEECGQSGARLSGDHVVELQDGGAPLDPANVKLTCSSCHTLKTNRERNKRMQRRS